jgi:hypothetical protein
VPGCIVSNHRLAAISTKDVTVGFMAKTKRTLGRLGLLTFAVVVLSALLLFAASLVLNNHNKSEPAGPTLTIAGASSPLPVTTDVCRRDPALCTVVRVAPGTSITISGVDEALGLSSPDLIDLNPAVRTDSGWAVGLPETPGTMLVTSGEHVWSFRIG